MCDPWLVSNEVISTTIRGENDWCCRCYNFCWRFILFLLSFQVGWKKEGTQTTLLRLPAVQRLNILSSLTLKHPKLQATANGLLHSSKRTSLPLGNTLDRMGCWVSTVIAEIFVRDLISYISYFWLKVRNLVAYENHARIEVHETQPSLYELR